MNRKYYYLIFICLLFFIGCNQQKDEGSLPNEPSNNRFIQVENPGPNQNHDLNNEQIAIHLANVAADVPNVNDAAAIVAGPYAVVGINVDADLDRSRVGTIKYSVSEALQHDPYGKTAVVVADPDIMERIRSMGEKIQEGYPIQGIVEELAAIVGRSMPDLPIEDDRPTDPDQNKQIMDDDEKEQLDDIEQDQSTE